MALPVDISVTSGEAAAALFAAHIAHELRTPLATQRAMLEVGLADPDADAAGWREIAHNLLKACEQQQRLLDACLALARSQRGLEHCEPVDLAVITTSVLREHDRCSLAAVVSLQAAWTIGNPRLVERLAANLVSNAIRHNVCAGRIDVATYVESGRAHLSIGNTGPRIPEDELERLFHPFRRLDPQGRCFDDGVGLGLAIVGAVADAHGALLTARARAGGGLEIDVSFPATPDPDFAHVSPS